MKSIFVPILMSALAMAVGAQSAAPAASDAPGRVPVPFGVGEKLAYDVKFGALRVGSGYMEVAGISDVRGREAWHSVFTIRGGTLFYKVNDRYESWFDSKTLESLRYHQDIDEGSYERNRKYEIFAERGVYTENKGKEQKTVAQPLDDGSFLYFIRTMPFSVGQTYTFNRYFKPDRNPVQIRVLRKERITVPAGTFNTVVVQPVIKSKGIFSEGGRAEVWISDDDNRMIVQLKSQLKFGSLNLYLRSFTPGK
jgi:hypothetical protein